MLCWHWKLQCIFSKDKNTVFYSHNIIIKIRKLTMLYFYLIYRSYSNFISFPTKVFYGKRKKGYPSALKVGTWITFSFHVPLVSFNLEQFFNLFFSHDIDIFKEYRPFIIRYSFNSGFFWYLQLDYYTFLAGASQKWCFVLLSD